MRFSEFLKKHSIENDGFFISEADIDRYWPNTLAEENVLSLIEDIKTKITNGLKSGVKLEITQRGSATDGECTINRQKYKTSEALDEASSVFESIKHLACLMTYSKIYEEAYRQELEKDHYGKDAHEIVLKHVEPNNINSVHTMDDLSDKFKTDRNKKVSAQFRYCVSSYCKEYPSKNGPISWFEGVIESVHKFFQDGYMEIRSKVKKELGHDKEE